MSLECFSSGLGCNFNTPLLIPILSSVRILGIHFCNEVSNSLVIFFQAARPPEPVALSSVQGSVLWGGNICVANQGAIGGLRRMVAGLSLKDGSGGDDNVMNGHLHSNAISPARK